MLKDKVAVITGGSRGIGAACAKEFAAAGANVCIIYANSDKAAQEVADFCTNEYKVQAKIYKCNVADFSATKALVKEIRSDFQHIDILVNNAGITRDGLIATMKEDNFDEVINTNLKGAFNMIRHCSPVFIRQRSGSIVNLSSVAGISGNAGQANYSASKAGIVGLTKSVARELAGAGVICNAVAPGFIATDMTESLNLDEETIERLIPLKRIGDAQELAQLIVFLAQSSYITGEVIRFDGGIAI